MSDCIFCDILAGKLSSSIVYQDDRSTALMDIQPINAGHVLFKKGVMRPKLYPYHVAYREKE